MLLADENTTAATPKRKVKDSVFTDFFSDPKHQMELYKALHPEDKTVSSSDFETVTIKSIATNRLYNDLSFTVRNKLMILVEAQSSWSYNIIVRVLMYYAEIIHDTIAETKFNIYGSKKFAAPKPEFYVVYTGTDKKNVKEVYSLADEFFEGDSSFIDLKVRILQADEQNMDIVTQYILFTRVLTDQVRTYGLTIEAIQKTIDICIDKGVLSEYLRSRKKEVISIMKSLFDQEEVNKVYDLELEIRGAIRAYRKTGMSDDDIVKNITGDYNVSEQYVRDLLHPAA